MAGLQGGDFLTGFASGALSSIAASAFGQGFNHEGINADGSMINPTKVWGGAGNFANSGAGMIAFGTIAGGAGASLTGGNFWQGAATGLVVSGLNHLAHRMDSDGPGDPPAKGKTSDGQLYGGDGSGSASDLFSRFVYETDQFNPIALAWDGLKGYLTGSDRYGNSLTSSQSNLKLATAIPIGKYASVSKSVWSHIFRNAAGHVNPATLSSQMRYYKLFQGVASKPANLVPTVNASARMAGVQTYNQTFRGGSTVWVQTINGRITNAGVNLP